MLALAGLTPGQRPAPPPPKPVSLIVLVVVDQMRADYLARFARQWTGGFGRIYRSGTVFEHGAQDHAATETAPGHATLLSGRYPAHTGIVLNSRGVQDADAPLVGRSGRAGASPHRFRGTTLVDWMLARDPDTRVLSVSRKDRGAIFPIGRAQVPVYWFDAGAFTTSRYYADSLPAWVQAFNEHGSVDRLSQGDATWSLLLPDSAYAEPDSEPFENGGADYAFPHPFPTARAAAVAQIARFPWMDSLTLAFALEGVRALGLGRRTGPDLLSMSLSTTDAVGHAFGPDSRELYDQLLHVDRWLGQFLDSLTHLIGNDRVLLVLTGDHGVTPIPEYNVTVRHRPGGRVSLGWVARSAGLALRARLDRDFGLDFDSGLLSADVASLRASGIDVEAWRRRSRPKRRGCLASPACTRPARSPERRARIGAQSCGDGCCLRTTAGSCALSPRRATSGPAASWAPSTARPIARTSRSRSRSSGPGSLLGWSSSPRAPWISLPPWRISSLCPLLSPSMAGCCRR